MARKLDFGKVNFAGFREFVFNQRPDKRINHCGGWASCALGDFECSLTGKHPRRRGELRFEASDAIEPDNSPEHKALYQTLNANGEPQCVELENGDVRNYYGRIPDLRRYGDLQDYITWLGI